MKFSPLIVLACVLGLPLCGQFIYTNAYLESGYAVASDPNNPVSGNIIIPQSYNGQPVVKIADYGFSANTGITSVLIPNTIMDIGQSAFLACTQYTCTDAF